MRNDYRLERWLATLLSLLFFLPFAARADELVKLDDVGRPELLIKTSQPGIYLAAPAVKSDLSIEIRGVIARGTIRQTFTNPTDHCVEAIYAFPLPENAAVDSLTLIVGGRRIEGEIKERVEAQQTYEQARSEGRAASLVEQHRPNLFTVSVANLADGETAQIELGYGQTLAYDDGRFSLRFPLAIGPRYQPADSSTAAPAPAMQHQIASKDRNPVSIHVDLDAGIPLREVASSTHAVVPTMVSATRWNVALRDEHIASDRDFELTWTPQLGSEPHSAVFSEDFGGSRYVLTMLFPADTSASPAAILPRETIFIIDTSGSMSGASITQAKRALQLAIDRLRGSDRFNVIQFNDTATPLFDAPRAATKDNIAAAQKWVAALEATNGTEMMSALQLALANQRGDGVRQVIFMTDGQVGNEDALFAYIRANLGNSRLFTVGIGAAPNSFFMRSAARYGRGTFTYVGNVSELEEKMKSLFRKLESPTLSNVELLVNADDAEIWPKRIGDLYAGEPLVVTAKLHHKGLVGTKFAFRGRLGTKSWDQTISDGQGPSAGAGIAKLWARQKVESLIDESNGAETAKQEIVAIGLEHHLVTPYTSLVAVDVTPKGVDPAMCKSELVPLNLPAGWGGLDGLPQTGTNAKLLILAGVVLLLLGALVVRSV
jgi:Ca-activated chloride channel family protein